MKRFNIAVVGGGIIGLTTAVEIQEKLGKFVNITIFTEDVSPNTTADVSAGLWGPFLIQNTPMCDIIKWGKIGHDYMHQLWKEGKAEECGISLVSTTALSEEDYEIPEWASIPFGASSISTEVLDAYGKEHGKTYKAGLTYLTFTLEPVKFLPYIQNIFIRHGGSVILRKINNFEELAGFDMIVNCPGLSAQYLAKDDDVKPIRGQVARVVAPWQYHALFTNDNYLIPNMNCIIMGGTHQDEYDLSTKKADTKMIENGCHNLVPAMKRAVMLKHMVGLRPGRSKIRLELETKTINGKPIYLVHNYGHGGSGVTFCKGCAVDACELVATALNVTKSKL